MKISFKKFFSIIQTETSPHEFTLLSSFKAKLIAAGAIFGGNVYYHKKKQKVKLILGIFDYCTLCIPFLISFEWTWAKNHKNPLVKYGLGFLIGLVHIPVEAVRIIASIVFALNPLTLLIAGIVHLVSEFIAGGKELKAAAAKLQLIHQYLKKSCSLKDEFNAIAHKAIPLFEPFDSLRIKVKADTEGRKLLEINHYVAGQEEPVGSKVCYLPVFSPDGTHTFSHENMKALQNLIRLNAGGVTRRLEKTEEGKILLGKIMATPTP